MQPGMHLNLQKAKENKTSEIFVLLLPPGLEPASLRFQIERLIHLSYSVHVFLGGLRENLYAVENRTSFKETKPNEFKSSMQF